MPADKGCMCRRFLFLVSGVPPPACSCNGRGRWAVDEMSCGREGLWTWVTSLCHPVASCWAGQSWVGVAVWWSSRARKLQRFLGKLSGCLKEEAGGEPTPAVKFGSVLNVFIQKTLIN